MTNIIKINDLQEGDILLYASGENFKIEGFLNVLCKLIMYFTDSKIFHAAIFSDKTKLELIEGFYPIARSKAVKDHIKGSTVYVMRRKFPKQLPLDPVIDAAKHYVNIETPYSFSTLLLIASLILYNKVFINQKIERVMIKVFKKLAILVANLINESVREDGSKAMMCSQLATQCYTDAGDDYKLKFENPILNKDRVESLLNNLLKESEHKKFSNSKLEKADHDELKNISTEELCEEICDAITSDSKKLSYKDLSVAFKESFYKFAYAYSLKQGYTKENIAVALKLIEENDNMLVTPEDLFHNCLSLEKIGILESS